MDWAIKIGYAVMVFAIIMCFIFSKRGEKEMRHMVDRFAQAFCKLSNYVLPGGKAPAASLSTRKKDGVMQALPAAEQPEELQKLMKRGTARHLAELYGQMEEASAELVYRCRRHRRNRELFADPIRQICYLTSVRRRRISVRPWWRISGRIRLTSSTTARAIILRWDRPFNMRAREAPSSWWQYLREPPRLIWLS